MLQNLNLILDEILYAIDYLDDKAQFKKDFVYLISTDVFCCMAKFDERIKLGLSLKSPDETVSSLSKSYTVDQINDMFHQKSKEALNLYFDSIVDFLKNDQYAKIKKMVGSY